MLSDIQQQLNDIYQVGLTYDVSDFLITDPKLARYMGGDALLRDSCETLLMSEDDEGLAMSLFLDAELLERVERGDPLTELRTELLDDLCQVLEGVSHFNYVAWKASQDRETSLLELELQAEIDKFISTMQLASMQGDSDMMRQLHGRLFDDVSFSEELSEEQVDRYRAANSYAARFCHRLKVRLLDNERGVLRELRHFYRLPMTDKISHIHAQTND